MELIFADANRAIRMARFIEMMFADDLQAYRTYDNGVKNSTLIRAAKNCQSRLHEWGGANQVEFDSNKESITILSRQTPYGESFKTLGVVFDPGLFMEEAISSIADAASWKLRTLLRTARFYSIREMVHANKFFIGENGTMGEEPKGRGRRSKAGVATNILKGVRKR